MWRTTKPLRCGSPLANDVGIEVLRSPRDYAAVKRALAEAGYKGEKIIVMAPTDVSELGNLTRTGAEQLRRAGMNVDQSGTCFAGTPDDVYNQIKALNDSVGGFGNLLMFGQGGFLDHADTVANITLFAKEVLPRLRELNPTPARADVGAAAAQ